MLKTSFVVNLYFLIKFSSIILFIKLKEADNSINCCWQMPLYPPPFIIT
jgi:hypothetical protein